MRLLTGLILLSSAGILTAAQKPAPPDCVTIGKANPKKVYAYQRSGTAASANQYTQQWEEITETGSRVRVTNGTDVIVQVNRHRIVDDVSVIDATTSSNRSGTETTTFRPGVIGDPAFKACAGRSWRISTGTASHTSTKTGTMSFPLDTGTLRIVSIRESVTVPAGRFDAVRYIRSLSTGGGETVDEYWKSIEHGVIVRHDSRFPGGSSTEVLIAIR